ncbi:MAG: ABC-F family ATP-binding cassette domain-containing protein [Candidatus Latescibacterota bacterium]|nr:MAG: ABC-F family ATP-binding cassette domain-containing protein [Candidatus Latescibacterota bacterium]
MIKISNLTKSFGDQLLFKELTFDVGKRERVGLVGRNGHGKTTLFHMILGDIEPDAGTVTIPKRYRIGHLDQNIRFTRDTVIGEASLALPRESRDQLWKAEKILFGLGFTTDDMNRSPEIFSGGFLVRLNLAKVLISEPELLLLDEPTNFLDVVSIRWLSRFLRQWRSELMLITHDRSFMDDVVTHTVGIHRQRARKIAGGTRKLHDQILREEEVYEKTRINDEKKRKEVERFIEKFRAQKKVASLVQSRVKMLAKQQSMEKLETIKTLDFSFNSAPFPAKVMMRVENLSYAYDAQKPLLTDFQLEIGAGERICIMGQNGKGKSTLMRLLAGDLKPQQGKITRHPRLQNGFFAQTNVHTLHPNNTVLDEIMLADRGCLQQTARDIAGSMMFEDDGALKKVSVLSGGEKSRVMLAKILVSPCNLLLLDEPTNHLDLDSCDSLLAAIDAFDGAVVIVTHNEMFLRSLANRFIVFDRGRIIDYRRSYQEFLDDIGWELDETLRQKDDADPEKAPPALDKKALRQERAKVIQERSRVVGPLEHAAAELEKWIEDLERQQAEALSAMEAASLSGDGEAIAEHSRRHEQLQKEIEAAFDQLDAATKAYDEAARDYDTRLDDLGG